MEVVHPRCGALDLGKDELVACVRIQEGARVKQECRTFKTTVKELLALSEWMASEGVSHIVMEATGTYWKPIWHVLEESFTLILANAAHVRGIPGRKSDVNDAMWLADLLAHGLSRGSFIPPAPIQNLRDLTRTRKQLVREIVQHTQRIQKTLDDANLKVTGLITDILGVTGRAVLKALIQGETNPERLADLARGRLRAKRSRLIEALHGWVTPHHRLLLKLHLDLIEAIEMAVDNLDKEIGDALAPFRDAAQRVKTVPGISDLAGQSVIAEIGVDMSRFPTHQHLLSWACLCPRLDQSAGKLHSTRTRKGAHWLKTLLIQCAWSAVQCKDTYLRAQFYRIRARRGPKKAIGAVAASMLTAITTSSVTTPNTATWDRTTSTRSTARGSVAASSAASKAWATMSSSEVLRESFFLGGPAFSDRRRTRKPKGTPHKASLSDVMDTTRFVLKPNLKWHKEDDTCATYGSPADGST